MTRETVTAEALARALAPVYTVSKSADFLWLVFKDVDDGEVYAEN